LGSDTKETDVVSVIIPTYNRAHSLKRAIESVALQNYHNWEIIIVDDGSDDGTFELVNDLKGMLKPLNIRYISITHSGVSRARNTGIDLAEGEWIAFLDSDDYWLPGKLEKQLFYLKQNPFYEICHTDEIWIKNGRRINQSKKHKKYEGLFFKPSLHLCLISPSSVLIHRRVFRNVGKFDETFNYVEDYEMWLRITSKYPVGYINEKLVVKTGGHPDQLSRKIVGIEKYRLRALEKLIKSGTLKKEFLIEAVKVYQRKAEIYLSGCRKRGKTEEIHKVQSQLNQLLAATERSF